jgi:hypothetical protein
MNAGVSTTPWAVTSLPARAVPSLACMVKVGLKRAPV